MKKTKNGLGILAIICLSIAIFLVHTRCQEEESSVANKAKETSASDPSQPQGLKLGAKELIELRTEYSKTFDNGDGTRTVYIGIGPVHYKDPITNKFEDISSSPWYLMTNDTSINSCGNYQNGSGGYIWVGYSPGNHYECWQNTCADYDILGWNSGYFGTPQLLDIPACIPSANINYATFYAFLKTYDNSGYGGPLGIGINRITTSWTEANPSGIRTVNDGNGGHTAGNWNYWDSFNVLNSVRKWKDGQPFYGFALSGYYCSLPYCTSWCLVGYTSSEYNSNCGNPFGTCTAYLEVSYSLQCTPGSSCCDSSGCGLPSGLSCNDGKACTSGDHCDGSGKCSGTYQCTPGSTCCDGSGCYRANGYSCSDGNACTIGDYCNGSGSCISGSYKCTPGSTCCNGSGCWLATGSSCNDGNACTSGETCNSSHQCTGGSYKCTPGSTCCDSSGCWLPSGSSCNDGNACSSGETCNSSHQCLGIYQCTPRSACCDASGCKLADGTACAAGGQCFNGSCVTICAYKVIKPNGGEKWTSGTRRRIKWTSYGPLCGDSTTYVKLQYSTNGGKRWRSIKKMTLNDGIQRWKVPDRATRKALVKVTDYDTPAYFDISDKNFKILSASGTTSYSSAESGQSPEEAAETSKIMPDGSELDLETGLVDLNPEDVAGETDKEEKFGCSIASGNSDSADLGSIMVTFGLPILALFYLKKRSRKK